MTEGRSDVKTVVMVPKEEPFSELVISTCGTRQSSLGAPSLTLITTGETNPSADHVEKAMTLSLMEALSSVCEDQSALKRAAASAAREESAGAITLTLISRVSGDRLLPVTSDFISHACSFLSTFAAVTKYLSLPKNVEQMIFKTMTGAVRNSKKAGKAKLSDRRLTLENADGSTLIYALTIVADYFWVCHRATRHRPKEKSREQIEVCAETLCQNLRIIQHRPRGEANSG